MALSARHSHRAHGSRGAVRSMQQPLAKAKRSSIATHAIETNAITPKSDRSESRALVKDTSIEYRFIVPRYETNWGQVIKIVGSLPELGGWNPAAAPTMQWNEGHKWTLTSRLPRQSFSFKVICMADGYVRWEEGKVNRSIDLDEAEPSGPVDLVLNLTCEFDNPESTQLAVLLPRRKFDEALDMAKAALEMLQRRKIQMDRSQRNGGGRSPGLQGPGADIASTLALKVREAIATQHASITDLSELLEKGGEGGEVLVPIKQDQIKRLPSLPSGAKASDVTRLVQSLKSGTAEVLPPLPPLPLNPSTSRPPSPDSSQDHTTDASYSSTNVDTAQISSRSQFSVSSPFIHTYPGDAYLGMGGGTNHIMAISQPRYFVSLSYENNAVLEGSTKIWAHIGHSGWRDSMDVELNSLPNSSRWVGEYSIPISQLDGILHLEVQCVFKGVVGAGKERWDNNGGSNWTTVVELSQVSRSLVTAPEAIAGTKPHALVSSLRLKLDALSSKKALAVEQVDMLRALAVCRDFALLSIYQQAKKEMWDEKRLVEAFKIRCGTLRKPGLYVVHIAAEMAPIAKVGGLADVVTSLARAHQATGTLVDIVLPKYDCIRYDNVEELQQILEFQVPWGSDGNVSVAVWSGITEGLPVYFIEPISRHMFFWRGRFYGEADDAARFLFFSRAALEFLHRSGKQPDILHVHDWQSAAVAPLLKEIYSGPVAASSLSKAGVVLTIHNIAFQGWLTPDFLSRVGLDPNRVYRSECLMDDGRPGFLPGHHDINLLKGGVVYADKVTTVSPTYAREVFDPHFGMGLESVLKRHGKKFKGVLNGIDYESWSPESDPLIPHHYSPADPPGAHAGKMACKRSLLQELGLPLPSLSQPGSHLRPEGDRPLLAVVSRLTDQKGLPLILHGIKAAISKGAMVVLLGSAPDPNVQKVFQYMSEELKQGSDARFILRHDEALSHRIYAGADMILIPSQFEPCGLTQLISLRYGTIPVVRETGGLVDTVKDVSDDSIPEHERNGFTFKDSSEAAVEHTIGRAIEAYSEGYDWWVGVLVRRAMNQDWSWSRSAQDYLQLYRSLQPA